MDPGDSGRACRVTKAARNSMAEKNIVLCPSFRKAAPLFEREGFFFCHRVIVYG